MADVVAVSGVDRPVNVAVDGPATAAPLVLIHGFGGSLGWLDDVTARLAGEFRVIRVDLLGHGATGGAGVDAPGQARMLEAVLAALDVRGAVVVGHSFGADVAVELGERSPRVDRLVIVAQAPDYSDAVFPRGSMLMTRSVAGPALLGLGRALTTALAAASAGGRGRLARRGRDPRRRALAPLAARDIRALDPAMFRVVLVQRRDRMARRPLDAQVRAAGKPTLVLLGGRDHFYGDRSARRYREAGARVEIRPDGGHSLLLDAPQWSAALIAEFVRGAS